MQLTTSEMELIQAAGSRERNRWLAMRIDEECKWVAKKIVAEWDAIEAKMEKGIEEQKRDPVCACGQCQVGRGGNE